MRTGGGHLLRSAVLLAALALVPAGWLAASPAAAATGTGPTVGGDALSTTGVVVDAPGAPPLPKVGASSYLLADLTTGEVLAARDPHGRFRPASTLKVLTALTVLPTLDPAATYTARWEDANAEGSRAGVVPDATYTVHELFQALFLVSGNDAASALANAAGGRAKTVAAMNTTAKRLGALDTTARNPSGLDAPGQYTSAYDLAVVARAAMQRPEFRDYVTTVKAQFPGKMPKPGHVRKTFEIFTQDRLLLNYHGAIGVKTGWTTKARGTFVGAATRDGHTLIATVMHTEGESWRESGELLSWGFAHRALARPVGTLDAVQPAAAAAAGTTTTDTAKPRTASIAGSSTGGRLTWWRVLLLVLVGVLALLRARVVLRRRARRRRGGLPRLTQSRVPRRVSSPASPAPSAAPTTTSRTVTVLRGDGLPDRPTGTDA